MSTFHKEYPRHVHQAGGVFAVVHSDAERDAHVAKGWYLTPLEADQAAAGVEVVTDRQAIAAAMEDTIAPPDAVPARRRKAKA